MSFWGRGFGLSLCYLWVSDLYNDSIIHHSYPHYFHHPLFSFMLADLLPDLLNRRRSVRENAMRLFERLSTIFGISLSQLLESPLNGSLIEDYGYSPIVLSPYHLGRCDPLMSSRGSSSAAPTAETPCLLMDVIDEQSKNMEWTLLGQLLLRLSRGSFRLSSIRSASLDVLGWLMSLRQPPIRFTSSFLLR